MKKIQHLLFVSILALGISSVFAQSKTFNNGKLTYKMDLKRNDPTYGEINVGSEITMTVKDKEVKTNTNTTLNGMPYMVMTYVVNRGKQTGIILVDAMGQKMAAKIAPADYLDFTKKQADLIAPENIEVTKEEKTILGYKCKKALVTNEDGQTATVYFTEALGRLESPEGSSLAIKGLDGIPLQITLSGADGDVNLQATDIVKGGVEASSFSYDVPAGYQEIDYQVLAQGAGM